jgi:hypothetical protein
MGLGSFKKQKKGGGLSAFKKAAPPAKPKSAIREAQEAKRAAPRKRRKKEVAQPKKMGMAGIKERRDNLRKAEEYVAHAQEIYDATFSEEARLFKKLDTLEMLRKKGGDKWYTVSQEWNKAMRENDKAYSVLLNASTHLNRLQRSK